jgi:ketosteroid isomerase-like protein
MSRENLEVVMAGYDAIERDDPQSGFELVAEDILWDMSRLGVPGLARAYRGHEGLGEFWTAWNSAWEGTEYLKLAPEDHGDHVLVEVEQRNRGRGSGITMEVHYFQAFTVREGKITASYGALTRAQALEAVGLRDG